MHERFSIESLFSVKTGDFHATKELDRGDVPLISCGEVNNGLVGFFGIPKNKQYSNKITVAYNGRPLTARYHPYIFGAKDDVAVLLPKVPLSSKTLIYVATLFNQQSWRYSYGRKCFKGKLRKLSVQLPVGSDGQIDEPFIEKLLHSSAEYLPKKDELNDMLFGEIKWELFNVTDIFDLKRGDFHSLAKLSKGNIVTVSRVSEDNGVEGYYEPPPKAKVYNPGLITVSTVTGDAFVQLQRFIATDNVVICVPKTSLRTTTLFFIQMMINLMKWRYSYGRQCYKTKFAQTKIYLPLDDKGELHEDLMKQVLTNTSYWSFLAKYLKAYEGKSTLIT